MSFNWVQNKNRILSIMYDSQIIQVMISKSKVRRGMRIGFGSVYLARTSITTAVNDHIRQNTTCIRPPYTMVHCRIWHRLPSYLHKFLPSEEGQLPATHTPLILYILHPFLLLSSSPPLPPLSLVPNTQKYLPLLVPMRWI